MDGEGSYSSSTRRRSKGVVSSGYRRDPQNCYCGIPWIVRTSWTEANPGRCFRKCRLAYEDGRGCKFFEWVDVDSCMKCRELIPGLLRKISKLEDQLMLYESNEDLKEFKDIPKGCSNVQECDCGHIWLLKNLKTILITICFVMTLPSLNQIVCNGIVFFWYEIVCNDIALYESNSL
ncbi:hypothetical protein CsatA_018681 [Cannabis sativa]